MKTLPSTTPYLIRAIYDWCCDTSQTPYVSVRVSELTTVPIEHIQDGEIVLNIGTGATKDLRIDNEAITFSARFDSVSREIYIAISDVKGIFFSRVWARTWIHCGRDNEAKESEQNRERARRIGYYYP